MIGLPRLMEADLSFCIDESYSYQDDRMGWCFLCLNNDEPLVFAVCARVYGGGGNAKLAEKTGLLHALMFDLASKANNTICFYLDCVNLVSFMSDPPISSLDR